MNLLALRKIVIGPIPYMSMISEKWNPTPPIKTPSQVKVLSVELRPVKRCRQRV